MEQFNLDIVVAKYKEDISWIDKWIPSEYEGRPVNLRRFIYSKYEYEYNPSYIRLPNIGNESHTYLHHIISHYDDLAEYILFSQGNPWDHAKMFDADLEGICFYDFLPIGDERHIDNDCGYPHGFVSDKSVHWYKEFYKDVFGSADCPKRFIYLKGSIFSVKREVVRHYDISFYKNVLGLMEKYKDINFKGVTWGHFMERMWTQMFNLKKEAV